MSNAAFTRTHTPAGHAKAAFLTGHNTTAAAPLQPQYDTSTTKAKLRQQHHYGQTTAAPLTNSVYQQYNIE